jgi:hypothetical protein
MVRMAQAGQWQESPVVQQPTPWALHDDFLHKAQQLQACLRRGIRQDVPPALCWGTVRLAARQHARDVEPRPRAVQ